MCSSWDGLDVFLLEGTPKIGQSSFVLRSLVHRVDP